MSQGFNVQRLARSTSQTDIAPVKTTGDGNVQQLRGRANSLPSVISTRPHVDTTPTTTNLTQAQPLQVPNIPAPLPPLPPVPVRAPGKHKAVQKRLMTPDQLVTKMGRPPKDDSQIFGKTIKKRSTNYKAVQSDLQSYQSTNRTVGRKQATTSRANRLMGRLDNVIAAADKYVKAQTRTPVLYASTKQKVAAMRELAASARTEKANLTALINDPHFATAKTHITIDQGIRLKGLGIPLNQAAHIGLHHDGNLDKGNSRSDFGVGQANTVAKLVYRPPADGAPKVFKAEKGSVQANTLIEADAAIGIDPNGPRFGNRNIASSIADEILGTNVIVKAKYADHKGQIGLLMDMADGSSPVSKRPVTLPTNHTKVQEELFKARADAHLKQIPLPQALLDRGITNNNDGTYSIAKMDVGIRLPFNDATRPAVSAAIQNKLCDLEWCDAFTGQMDRHSSNYMISVSPGGAVKLTGIDNDCCFGKAQTGIESFTSAKTGATIRPRVPPPHNGMGLPQLISRETFNKINGLDWDTDVAPRFEGLLSDEELAATKSRFIELQTHARSLVPNFVVDNWQTWRDPTNNQGVAAFLLASPQDSYFKRDVETVAAFNNQGMGVDP